MRTASFVPTMSVVMLERPFGEEEWWYVSRGMVKYSTVAEKMVLSYYSG
jgi:hypothetical protein